MIKVLMTGGGGAGNEALFRLMRGRYVLHFADADVEAIDPCISEGQRHQVPWASDLKYVSKMAELCRRLQIDLLIPGVDEELVALAKSAEELLPTQLLLPDLTYVETMLDKLRMVQSLSAKKIPVPQTEILTGNFQVIRFPCISKPRQGRGSRGVSVLGTLDEAKSLKSKLGARASEMLLQQKIEGIEYTVQMVADSQRKLCAIVPVRVGIKRGITIRAETEAEPRVIDACRAIHQAIPTKGCYNIQLIMDSNGDIYPFEINPRISTTFCLVVAAGVDPISIYLSDNQASDMLPFESGIKLQRHWANHFLGKNNEIQYS